MAAMGLSTAARSALTAVCKGLSREVARDNVTINNLLPERIDTDRQRFMAELRAKSGGVSIEQAYAEIAATIAAGRLGRRRSSARRARSCAACTRAYVSGQNLQLDGGAYPGLV